METIGIENLGSTPPLDTLAMAKYLRQHGYTKEQAEGQVELLKHVVDSNLATKTDLKELEYRMTIKLGAIVAAIVGFFAVIDKIF